MSSLTTLDPARMRQHNGRKRVNAIALTLSLAAMAIVMGFRTHCLRHKHAVLLSLRRASAASMRLSPTGAQDGSSRPATSRRCSAR